MSFTSQLDMMLLLFLALLLSPLARAQQTFFPAAIPLAVRSPYLSSWNHITSGSVFGQLWPDTYTPNQVARHRQLAVKILIFVCFRSSDGPSSYA